MAHTRLVKMARPKTLLLTKEEEDDNAHFLKTHAKVVEVTKADPDEVLKVCLELTKEKKPLTLKNMGEKLPMVMKMSLQSVSPTRL